MEEKHVPQASYRQAVALNKKWEKLLEGLDHNAAEWLLENFEEIEMLARCRPKEGLIVHPAESYRLSRYIVKPLTPRIAALKEANLLRYESSWEKDDDPRLFPGNYTGEEIVRLELSKFLRHRPRTRRDAALRFASYGLTTHAVIEQMVAFAKGWKPEDWLKKYEPCRIIGLGSTAFCSHDMIVPVLLSPGCPRDSMDRDIARWRLDYNYAERGDLHGDDTLTWFMTAHPVE